jgi:hypothetical protein
LAEYLAPLSTLEDDKIYSEIPEKQFWNDEENKSERSFVSEEAIRDETETNESRAEAIAKSELQKIEELKEELKTKLNLGDFDVEVTPVILK